MLRALRIPSSRRPLLPARTPGQRNVVATQGIPGALRTTNATQVVGDQCQYGQETAKGCPIKKPTRWLSNSPKILEALEERCGGRAGECSRAGGGNHAPTSGKVTREAAVYPFKLCRAILKGCARQLQAGGRLQLGHHGVQGFWDNDEDNTTTTHYEAGRCGAHTAPEPLCAPWCCVAFVGGPRRAWEPFGDCAIFP